MIPLKQSAAITIPFFAHDANGDGVTGIADGSWTKRVSKNGGAFGPMTVTITEMENGWYSIPLSASHTDTLGALAISLSAAACKRVNLLFRVAVRLEDDLAYPSTSGRAIDVDATGGVEITANQAVNVAQWNGSAVAAPATAGVPRVAIEQAADFAQAAADKVWSTAARTLTSFGTLIADIWTYATRALTDKAEFTLSTAGIQAIWDRATSALTTVGSIGKLVVDNVNATISSRSSHAAADIWAVATRLLTAGTNIVLAKGVGVTGFNDLSAADVRTAVGLAAANLDTQLGAIKTDTAAILADTGTDGVVVAAGSKAGYELSAAGVDAVLDEVVEGTRTVRQYLRGFASALLAKLSGAATTTIVIRDTADTKDRVTATVDADGNRSAVTLDLT